MPAAADSEEHVKLKTETYHSETCRSCYQFGGLDSKSNGKTWWVLSKKVI